MTHSGAASVATLEAVFEAFNAHDLDAILEFFTEDPVFDASSGPEPWGRRFEGRAAVREALEARFAGIPDVHYAADRHWVSGDGGAGVSEWLVTGTTVTGTPVAVRGVDLWEFRGAKIQRKDSFWKNVEH